MSRLLDPMSGNQVQPLQPMLQQAMQPQGMAPQARGGFGSRLKEALPTLLMGLGAEISSGFKGGGAQFLQQAGQQRQGQAARNATVEWLQARNPELAGLVAQGALEPMQAIQMASQKPDKPSSVQEYEYAKGQGFGGSFNDFLQAKRQSVTVNNQIGGEPGDAALRKKLDEKTGETWAGYQNAGAVSGQLVRDLDMLDELGKMAPQGPLQGRAAELFPGFSTAGDAYQSIVARVAPSLRQEGSGSTSDIEYAGFLKSLPALRNQPGANALISQIMRQKAQIDVERAKIVTAYNNGQITATDARTKMSELNGRSILTPELQQLLTGVGNSNGAPDEIESLVDKYRSR